MKKLSNKRNVTLQMIDNYKYVCLIAGSSRETQTKTIGKLSPRLRFNSHECVTAGLVGSFLFLFTLFSLPLSLASLSNILRSVTAAQCYSQMSVLTRDSRWINLIWLPAGKLGVHTQILTGQKAPKL